MQAVQQDTVKVSPVINEQLIFLSGLTCVKYVAKDDDYTSTITPLHDRLLGRHENRKRGGRIGRSHCRKWPDKMTNPAFFDWLASIVDDDLATFSADLLKRTATFVRRHAYPGHAARGHGVVDPPAQIRHQRRFFVASAHAWTTTPSCRPSSTLGARDS